jgi:hypothetical protein
MTITGMACKGPTRLGDHLFDRFEREVSWAALPSGPVHGRPVTEDDLVGLPPAARRYFGFMGVIGRPRDWSFRARFVGRFRLNPKLGWMPAQAWQYNSAITVGRVFVMRIRFARMVSMVGVDTYLDGHSRTHQGLRHPARSRRGQPHRRAGRGVRLPGPERRRQDHHHPTVARPAAPYRRVAGAAGRSDKQLRVTVAPVAVVIG